MALLLRAIERDFGGADQLKKAMKTAALGQFGSGWAVLAADGQGGVRVLKTANQDTTLPLRPPALLRCVGARLLPSLSKPQGGLF